MTEAWDTVASSSDKSGEQFGFKPCGCSICMNKGGPGEFSRTVVDTLPGAPGPTSPH